MLLVIQRKNSATPCCHGNIRTPSRREGWVVRQKNTRLTVANSLAETRKLANGSDVRVGSGFYLNGKCLLVFSRDNIYLCAPLGAKIEKTHSLARAQHWL